MDGYLDKRAAGLIKHWQRRWFSRDQHVLSYFLKKGDKTPRGVINLLELTLVEIISPNSDDESHIRFNVHVGKRVYHLKAPSHRERDAWVESLAVWVEASTKKDPVAPPRRMARAILGAMHWLQTDDHCKTAKGIFRVQGAASNVTNVVRSSQILGSGYFTRGLIPKDYTVHDVACGLKRLIRILPEPLLTYALIQQFQEAKNVEQVKNLVEQLPHWNAICLGKLMEVCEEIVDNNVITMMNIEALAICMGPNLSPGDAMILFDYNDLFAIMIRHREMIFREINMEDAQIGFSTEEYLDMYDEELKLGEAQPNEAIIADSLSRGKKNNSSSKGLKGRFSAAVSEREPSASKSKGSKNILHRFSSHNNLTESGELSSTPSQQVSHTREKSSSMSQKVLAKFRLSAVSHDVANVAAPSTSSSQLDSLSSSKAVPVVKEFSGFQTPKTPALPTIVSPLITTNAVISQPVIAAKAKSPSSALDSTSHAHRELPPIIPLTSRTSSKRVCDLESSAPLLSSVQPNGKNEERTLSSQGDAKEDYPPEDYSVSAGDRKSDEEKESFEKTIPIAIRRSIAVERDTNPPPVPTQCVEDILKAVLDINSAKDKLPSGNQSGILGFSEPEAKDIADRLSAVPEDQRASEGRATNSSDYQLTTGPQNDNIDLQSLAIFVDSPDQIIEEKYLSDLSVCVPKLDVSIPIVNLMTEEHKGEVKGLVGEDDQIRRTEDGLPSRRFLTYSASDLLVDMPSLADLQRAFSVSADSDNHDRRNALLKYYQENICEIFLETRAQILDYLESQSVDAQILEQVQIIHDTQIQKLHSLFLPNNTQFVPTTDEKCTSYQTKGEIIESEVSSIIANTEEKTLNTFSEPLKPEEDYVGMIVSDRISHCVPLERETRISEYAEFSEPVAPTEIAPTSPIQDYRQDDQSNDLEKIIEVNQFEEGKIDEIEILEEEEIQAKDRSRRSVSFSDQVITVLIKDTYDDDEESVRNTIEYPEDGTEVPQSPFKEDSLSVSPADSPLASLMSESAKQSSEAEEKKDDLHTQLDNLICVSEVKKPSSTVSSLTATFTAKLMASTTSSLPRTVPLADGAAPAFSVALAVKKFESLITSHVGSEKKDIPEPKRFRPYITS